MSVACDNMQNEINLLKHKDPGLAELINKRYSLSQLLQTTKHHMVSGLYNLQQDMILQ